MQQRANTPETSSVAREAANRGRAARRRLAWRFHLGRARPSVGGAEFRNCGHQRHQRRRHECRDSRRWPAPRRSGAGAACSTALLGGCRPPAGLRELAAPRSRTRTWHLDNNPAFLWADMLTRIWSPYQINPTNYNPLEELLERIDFEGLRDDPTAARVFICATNVRTGLRRVFDNAELSPDVLLASGCLPQLYQAVQIGEDFYWDGGYTGNPALAPLYLGTNATDVIVVGINPMERTSVPQTARGIIDRIDEISFNSTFMLELGAIAFVEQLMKSAAVQAPVQAPLRAWHRRRGARCVRRIEQDEQRMGVPAASARDRDGGPPIVGSRRTSRRSGTAPRSISRGCFRRGTAPSRRRRSPSKSGFQQPMPKPGVLDMKINDVRRAAKTR